MKLPVAFEEKIRQYLGEDWAAYEESFKNGGFYGMRCNTLKVDVEQLKKQQDFMEEQVPWCEEGFYYNGLLHQPAKHPYYHAGLYYIQEPSAMLPASLLPVEPGDKVLDLCAAPGGKSTQIASKLQGKGLLVSNDISISRAKALVKNLEMAGVVNAVVTSEKPEKLAKVFEGFFDKVLVDAPCSGEGMFRKNPLMVKDYKERGVEYYAPLQKEIMEQAVAMLKPGGSLVYSTCTFSAEENEGMVQWILENYPEMSVESGMDFAGRDCGHPEWIGSDQEEIKRAYRMWPHRIDGEGHFAVLMKKAEGPVKKAAMGSSKVKLTEEAKAFFREFPIDDSHGYYVDLDNKLYLVPEEMPVVKGIRVVRSGLYLGLMKKNRFEPSQAMAMALKMEEVCKKIDFSIDDGRVLKYLKCETIMTDGPEGYVLIGVDGYPLGWGKLKNAVLKNKYAPGWRFL